MRLSFLLFTFVGICFFSVSAIQLEEDEEYQINLFKQHYAVHADNKLTDYQSLPETLMSVMKIWKRFANKPTPPKRLTEDQEALSSPPSAQNGVELNIRKLKNSYTRPRLPPAIMSMLNDASEIHPPPHPRYYHTNSAANEACPSSCNTPQGTCVDGVCRCALEWTGDDCSEENKCNPGYRDYRNITHFYCNGNETNAAAAAFNQSGTCFSNVSKEYFCQCPMYLKSGGENCTVWRNITCVLNITSPALDCPNITRYEARLDSEDACIRVNRTGSLNLVMNWTCRFDPKPPGNETQDAQAYYEDNVDEYNPAWDYWVRNEWELAIPQNVEAYAYWKGFNFHKLSDNNNVFWRKIEKKHWLRVNYGTENETDYRNLESLWFPLDFSSMSDKYVTANRLYSEADVYIVGGLPEESTVIRTARRYIDFDDLTEPQRQRTFMEQFWWIFIIIGVVGGCALIGLIVGCSICVWRRNVKKEKES